MTDPDDAPGARSHKGFSVVLYDGFEWLLILPFGVNLREVFDPMERERSRKRSLDPERPIVVEGGYPLSGSTKAGSSGSVTARTNSMIRALVLVLLFQEGSGLTKAWAFALACGSIAPGAWEGAQLNANKAASTEPSTRNWPSASRREL